MSDIKQTTTLTPEQLIALLEQDATVTINVRIAGDMEQWVEIQYRLFYGAVKAPYYAEKIRSFEVIHYFGSGELYVFEVNKVAL